MAKTTEYDKACNEVRDYAAKTWGGNGDEADALYVIILENARNAMGVTVDTWKEVAPQLRAEYVRAALVAAQNNSPTIDKTQVTERPASANGSNRDDTATTGGKRGEDSGAPTGETRGSSLNDVKARKIVADDGAVLKDNMSQRPAEPQAPDAPQGEITPKDATPRSIGYADAFVAANCEAGEATDALRDALAAWFAGALGEGYSSLMESAAGNTSDDPLYDGVKKQIAIVQDSGGGYYITHFMKDGEWTSRVEPVRDLGYDEALQDGWAAGRKALQDEQREARAQDDKALDDAMEAAAVKRESRRQSLTPPEPPLDVRKALSTPSLADHKENTLRGSIDDLRVPY